MFKKLVEMNVIENIKVLHIDRSGGYLSKHSTNKKKNSKQMVVPYIAHNNGVVKKKNKTILEKVRNMAIEKNYPTYLWNDQIILRSI